MAVFKCKMCGGTIEFEEGSSVGICDSCGTKQTLPKTNDEERVNRFNRANDLRMHSQFDRAAKIYEEILEADNTDAEAHWGAVLCKYGIEYVDDPKTGTKIPTCHRTLFEAVKADPDFKAAIECGEAEQRIFYEKEAGEIDRIQREILAIVRNEKPFDVFICYKETDEAGKRTIDSSIANDIYYHLTEEGFKVFYAAITLEDKLGQEYEPYIFAALNSAKVMLVIGTKPEYFSAVWVKNEWSRYMQLMKTDRSKQLFPCYRDMDPYDMPDEFAHLQAQDMGKIGFISDIVRGIKKIVGSEQPKAAETPATAAAPAQAGVEPLLKRALLFLEDANYTGADNCVEKVLDREPENAKAYLIKLMMDVKARRIEDLANCAEPFDNNGNYKKAVRFADQKLTEKLTGFNAGIKKRNEAARLSQEYDRALKAMQSASTGDAFREAAGIFSSIAGYNDADDLKLACEDKAKDCYEREHLAAYNTALDMLGKAESPEDFRRAESIFRGLGNYKDAREKCEECEKLRVEKEKQIAYEKALELMKNAEKNLAARKDLAQTAAHFKKAAEDFSKLAGFRDSLELSHKCVSEGQTAGKAIAYVRAEDLLAKGLHTEAANAFDEAGDYADAQKKGAQCRHKLEADAKKAKTKKAFAKSFFAVYLIEAILVVLAYIFVIIAEFTELGNEVAVSEINAFMNVFMIICVLGGATLHSLVSGILSLFCRRYGSATKIITLVVNVATRVGMMIIMIADMRGQSELVLSIILFGVVFVIDFFISRFVNNLFHPLD